MKTNIKNKSIFEDMSVLNMEMFHLPPLTANIFTLMMFDFEKKGVTFEEILEITCASKSSVSNALTRLLNSHHIEFINKLDDRKRYYRINKEVFGIHFQDTIIRLRKHKDVLQRYKRCREEVLQTEDENSSRIYHLIELQEKTIELLENSLEKLNQNKN